MVSFKFCGCLTYVSSVVTCELSCTESSDHCPLIVVVASSCVTSLSTASSCDIGSNDDTSSSVDRVGGGSHDVVPSTSFM